MKKVLITGATGFCGRYLCSYLHKMGYRVKGTYHNFHDPNARHDYPLVPLNIQDRAAVYRLIDQERPDGIFHLAAQSVPRLSWELQDQTFGINVGGTLHLLNAMRKFSPGSRMVYTSSIQVYGNSFATNPQVDEGDLLWPGDPYAASKALSEFACLNFAQQFKLDLVIARAFNHVGAGQSVHYVFSDWCRQIALAEKGYQPPVLQVGNLVNRRDILHVDDVVRAYEILFRKGKPGAVYNIASGRLYSLLQCLEFLVKKSKVQLKVQVQKKKMQRVLPVMKGSASRLKALGWRAENSALDALEDLLEDWRKKISRGATG